jgi:hypothetical protein
MRGKALKLAVLAGLVSGGAINAAAAGRSGESLPRARATLHRNAPPARAVTDLSESSRLLGVPLFLALGLAAAVSAVVVVAASGTTDSEG